MSSEILYDKAFIRVGEQYIPVVNHGSSNCFDFDRRGREIPEKHWSVFRYPYRDRLIFSEEEVRQIAEAHEAASVNNYGGTRKSRNRTFEAGEVLRWFLNGMKSAHTVEEYRRYGNTAAVIDYDEPVWRKYFVSTTEELLEKIQELSGRSIGVTFMDDRHVTHPPMRRKGMPTDYSTLPEYYVLRSEQGYFAKRSSKHVWFTRNLEPRAAQVRKFKTEKAARKYLDDNQKSFARFAFEVECVAQNGGVTV